MDDPFIREHIEGKYIFNALPFNILLCVCTLFVSSLVILLFLNQVTNRSNKKLAYPF